MVKTVRSSSFAGGKHITDIDSITLANNTTLNHDIVVPAGKRWQILTIKGVNCDDVARAISMTSYNEAAATSSINLIAYNAAVGATGELMWPNDTYFPYDLILSAGQMIRVTFVAGGASAGGTDADGVVVSILEVDV